MNCAVTRELDEHLNREAAASADCDRRDTMYAELVGNEAAFRKFIRDQFTGLTHDDLIEKLADVTALRFASDLFGSMKWSAARKWSYWCEDNDEEIAGLIDQHIDEQIRAQDRIAADDIAAQAD